eukprot:1196899-Amphidinium_carterae.1
MAAAEHPRFVAALTQEQYGSYLVGWRPFGEDPIIQTFVNLERPTWCTEAVLQLALHHPRSLLWHRAKAQEHRPKSLSKAVCHAAYG